jgi:pSer/pThr/pTyr-binding forkhead associated (FHA) protein
MRLRLKVAPPTGQASTFEHAGPVIRIGRDSGCELELRGEASQSVSREHARIDLRAEGAILADLGSSNGTLLNDERLSSPRPIRVGDRIRLGYTGATLTVVDLDLTAPRVAVSEPPPVATQRLAPWIVAAVAAAVLAIALGVWLRSRRTAEPESNTVAEVQPPTPTLLPDPLKTLNKHRSGGGASKTDAVPGSPARPPATPPKPPPAPVPAAPQDEDREVAVGAYVVQEATGPSVLMERRGEGYPRTRVRRGAPVSSAHELLCLPGYRAQVHLDSDVDLTLWGNVPEFCSAPLALLESVVMLKAPEAGQDACDLDLVLIRGRIKLSNAKKAGAARVRLRFLREAWEITLADAESEVCAELWGLLLPEARGAVQTQPLTIGVFTKGRVAIRLSPKGNAQDLANHTLVRRLNERNAQVIQTVLPRLPGWWERPPSAKEPREADVMASLSDWNEELRDPGDLVDEVFRRCETGAAARPGAREGDAIYRSVGVYFLGAFDSEGMPWVVRLLEDPGQSEVRRAAAHTLRAWLARDARNSDALTLMLQARMNRPQAATVLRLLSPFPEVDVKDRDKRQGLCDELLVLLDDGSLAVRELAAWHLEEMARQVLARELPAYDAGANSSARRPVVQQWKQFLTASSGAAR